uniref:NADH-ubiquinone oxidoreductase chain 6 n=1 Tax=Scydosella musawasensis TaxID=1819563 RepID=A0A165CYQ4_9COLE|nr:NADH dehydrogenase subunit 6 [Scydosella musawasensis]
MIVINMLTSMLFIFMKHPLSMGLMLMINTILISISTNLMNWTSWFSYLLFLIMVGGMLILFMYMTSIASNHKFLFNMNWIMLMTLSPMIYIMHNYLTKYYNTNYKNYFNKYETELIIKITNFPNNIILAMVIIYLLITLIAVVKITNFKKSTFRMN